MKTKQCTKCKETKDTSNFCKNARYKDGYFCWCRQCRTDAAKEHRKKPKNKKYAKEYWSSERGKQIRKRYSMTEKGKESARKCATRHRKRHPQQAKAVSAVKHEIKMGRMTHPTKLKCECCDNKAIEYHHHKGYAKKYWLDVIPICKRCHHNIHELIEILKNWSLD